ncbi:helix-turn-helix transcriptional regulator [Priestia koreensis]|uniref:helix-turn-helix domain-containing protein n=1 Tax=Priestia koreensis TaxID=284581 RepID=UPI003017AB22
MRNIDVRALRLLENMSQKEFAATIGCSESNISMIETGQRTLTDRVRTLIYCRFPIRDEVYARRMREVADLFN